MYVGQNSRKMAANFVCVHVASFPTSPLAVALRRVMPSRGDSPTHVFLWMILPAKPLGHTQWLLSHQLCRFLQETAFGDRRLLPWTQSLLKGISFIDQNEKCIELGKKPHSVCVFLLAHPGIFTPIEYALETLSTHRSCVYFCLYHE